MQTYAEAFCIHDCNVSIIFCHVVISLDSVKDAAGRHSSGTSTCKKSVDSSFSDLSHFAGTPFKHSAPWSERSPCNGYGLWPIWMSYCKKFLLSNNSSKWAIAIGPSGLGLGFSSGCFFHSVPCAESSSKRSCFFFIVWPSKVRGRRMRGSSALFTQMGCLA